VRNSLSEALGTALISMTVVGSAFMAANLTDDQSLRLLINAIATAMVLLVVIYLFAPISGAHFNPVVTIIFTITRKMTIRDSMKYLSAQFIGGICGTVLANLMFTSESLVISNINRNSSNNFLGELIATTILLLIILLCIEQGRSSAIPYLVPAWIGSAYFSTVSTSFANPAITLARSFSANDTGINLTSTPAFIAVQLLGGMCALGLVKVFAKK
jgi:glycerol uptake facilitator-like aquaporin